MKKIKIYGAGNEGKFNYVIISRNKDFFSWLSKLLFKSFKIKDAEFYEFVNKKDEWITRKKQLKNFIDRHESYLPKGSRIDIFYGKEKIFLVLNTSLRERRKFMKNLNELSIWVKPPKTKQKKDYIKKMK
jgi:hypothetical protein|tara:strand:+ start:52 stop:441 length:390 start_codon:yes stop_codon:yes gene_type:complete